MFTMAYLSPEVGRVLTIPVVDALIEGNLIWRQRILNNKIAVTLKEFMFYCRHEIYSLPFGYSL